MARNKPNKQNQEDATVEDAVLDQETDAEVETEEQGTAEQEHVTETSPEAVSELAQAVVNADPKQQDTKPVEPAPTPAPQEPVVVPPAIETPAPTVKSETPAPVGPAAGIAMELEEYAQAMKPGQYVPAATGADYQRKLYRLIERTINRVPDEAFKDCMDTLLGWFHDNINGVAGEAYVFRFPGEWRGTAEEYSAYIRLITLFQQLANPATRREVAATTGFEYYLQFGTTEAGRERVLAFFGK